MTAIAAFPAYELPELPILEQRLVTTLRGCAAVEVAVCALDHPASAGWIARSEGIEALEPFDPRLLLESGDGQGSEGRGRGPLPRGLAAEMARARVRVVLPLLEGQRLYGVVALWPAAHAGAAADLRAAVAPMMPLLAAAARARVEALDSECQALAVRALGGAPGPLLLAERGMRVPLWMDGGEGGPAGWVPVEVGQLLGDADEALAAVERDRPDERGAVASFRRGPWLVRARALAGAGGPGAAAGRPLLAMQAERAGADTPPEVVLSARERAVADLLAQGFSVLNIAAAFALSEHTVRTYVRRLYRKLGVGNRADLVRAVLADAR